MVLEELKATDEEFFAGSSEGKIAIDEDLRFHSRSDGLFEATAGRKITVICKLEETGYRMSLTAWYRMRSCLLPKEVEAISIWEP